jgi:2'-5' RNA ligase
MQKLFVGIAIPEILAARMAQIQPQAMPGIRVVAADQMHVTLRFIGEAQIGTVEMALASIQCSAFEFDIEGVGRFPSQNGSTTLWAGVRRVAELSRLHSLIGEAVAATGFAAEARPYVPHVTLARCEPLAPEHVLESFVAQGANVKIGTVSAREFSLYSSEGNTPPVYRVQRTFALTAG